MPLARVLPVAVLLPLLVVLGASPPCHGASSHNITAILAGYPDLSEFSAALTRTGTAAEVDRRTTVTVLAVGNAVMAQLRARNPTPEELRRAVSLHVLLDYYDDAKFGSIRDGFAQAASLFQASGEAQGSDGMVNITVARGGSVSFVPSSAPTDAPPAAFFQKALKKSPYDIAVLQVSALIWSPPPAAAGQAPPPAPAPAPQPDAAPRLADLLSKNGCGGFAALLAASADAAATFERSAGGPGLTVFCPADKAVSAFDRDFKNLTADGQAALLLYHGVPAHYSPQSLRAINGDVSTLATDGSKKYRYKLTVRADGGTVKLSSAAPSPARVTKTVLDKAPLAVYLIDAVLQPRELSNHTDGPTAPAPAPEPAHAPAPVPAPATAPTPRRRPAPAPEESGPAPSPDADNQPPADQKSSGGNSTAPWALGVAVAAAVSAIMLVM